MGGVPLSAHTVRGPRHPREAAGGVTFSTGLSPRVPGCPPPPYCGLSPRPCGRNASWREVDHQPLTSLRVFRWPHSALLLRGAGPTAVGCTHHFCRGRSTLTAQWSHPQPDPDPLSSLRPVPFKGRVRTGPQHMCCERNLGRTRGFSPSSGKRFMGCA